jgi:hypothetical protein
MTRCCFADRELGAARSLVTPTSRGDSFLGDRPPQFQLRELTIFRITRGDSGFDSDTLARSFDMLVKRPDQRERPLPVGTRAGDVYDSMDESLLILGAPGSGKTTELLELCKDLLDRAAHDPDHPIPVVFPLSTWAETRKPLVEWLQAELNLRYDVPRAIAQEWVATDLVLPLLDGLDEVKAEHRFACVEAINLFRQSHGFLPLAIASRRVEYETLAEPLRLHGAILVQPLTREQVNAYFAELGPAGESIRAAIRDDPMKARRCSISRDFNSDGPRNGNEKASGPITAWLSGCSAGWASGWCSACSLGSTAG